MKVFVKYIFVIAIFLFVGNAAGSHASDRGIVTNELSASVNSDPVLSGTGPVFGLINAYLLLMEAFAPASQVDLQENCHCHRFLTMNRFLLLFPKIYEQQVAHANKFACFLGVRHLHGFYVYFLEKLIL